jgi:hypothetical protein
MAAGRKGKQGDDPGALPDGTVRWTAAMRGALAEFRNTPCRQCGATLSENQPLHEQLDHIGRHPQPAWQQRPQRLRVLELHGAGALPLFLEPAPRKEALADLLAIHHVDAVRFLAGQVRHPECKTALAKQAERWPLLVLRELLAANPARHQAGAALVLELLAAHPEWQAPLEAACDEPQRKALARLQADEGGGLADAEPAQWPAFLRAPPWKDRQALPAIPVLALDAVERTARLHWQHAVPRRYPPVSGEPAQWLADEVREAQQRGERQLAEYPRPHHTTQPPPEARAWDRSRKALWMLGLKAERIEDAIRDHGASLSADDFGQPPGDSWSCGDQLWQLPEPLAMAVFARLPPASHYMGDASYLRPLLHRFGTAALPGLPPYLKQGSRAMFELAAVIEWDRLAPWIAKGFHGNRWARQEACAWLGRYPEAAARGLVPDALGAPGTARDAAQAALRWLHEAGHADAIHAQAMAYGPVAAEAVSQLLAIAPEHLLPETLPVPPKSLPLSTLPRLVLAADATRALPASLLPDVLMTMALGKPETPYPGLAALQAAVAPEALARFARALLAWWIGNGRPGKERWMFALQGRLGDDETTRQLASLLRQWRAALDRVRAYDALAMLGEIGSDAALMHLGELARQTRYADLNARASALLDEVAAQRGLSLAQLADRTVPELGLDARAGLTLDFGPRRFTLQMDDRLQPLLRDGAGKPLKALPKPNAADDAALAAAATEQLKELRKLAKTVAATQLRRLEAAMCEQRRWTHGEFMAFLVRHPVMRVFVRQLVWGLFDQNGALAASFRVSAEGELVDPHDDTFALPDDENARIGIAHPLEFAARNPALANAWASVLADYEIVQPFEQLARAHFALDLALRTQRALPQWTGRTVTNAGLLGLEARGWQREVGDGGMVHRFGKPVGEGLAIWLRVEEGWYVQGAADPKAQQTVAGVALEGAEGRSLGDVAPIAWSEVERDLQRAVWAPAA